MDFSLTKIINANLADNSVESVSIKTFAFGA
jgi:hypothetical protein